jgi:hypothetical protein
MQAPWLVVWIDRKPPRNRTMAGQGAGLRASHHQVLLKDARSILSLAMSSKHPHSSSCRMPRWREITITGSVSIPVTRTASKVSAPLMPTHQYLPAQLPPQKGHNGKSKGLLSLVCTNAFDTTTSRVPRRRRTYGEVLPKTGRVGLLQHRPRWAGPGPGWNPKPLNQAEPTTHTN